MADTINQLEWLPIDKNDKIEELIDKLNFNFSQFALYNGGVPGADGEDGDDAMVTKSRSAIHYIPDDGEEHDYTISEVKAYYSSSDIDDELLDGDMIIYGSCIFSYKESTSSFSKITTIKGEQGEKGETGSVGEKFFDLNSTNNSSTTSSESDNMLSFTDDKYIKGIMLENTSGIFNTSETEGYFPISFENYEENSILFTKNSTDGFSFFKVNNKKRVLDTQIKHNIVSDSETGETKNSRFDIIDDSTDGIFITTNNNELTLQSQKNVSTTSNDLSYYKYSINIGKKSIIGDDNYGINILSSGDLGIKYSNKFALYRDNNEIVSIDDSDSDSDYCDNTLSISNISDIVANTTNGLNLIASSSSLSFNTDSLSIINPKISWTYESGSDSSTSLNIDSEELSYTTKSSSETTTHWSIDKSGNTSLKSLQIYDEENSERLNVSDIFSRLDGGFTQFVSSKEETNGRGSYTKKELREQIGAADADTVDGLVKSGTHLLYENAPIGTIIMSGLYTCDYIVDNCGGLFAKCDGRIIKNGTTINYYTYDSTGNKVSKSTTFKLPNEFKLSLLTTDNVNITLPDFTARFPLGFKKSTYLINSYGGSETVTLTENQIPSHNHRYAGNDDMKNQSPYSPFNTWIGASKSGSDKGSGYLYYTEKTGGGQPHNNMPPYCVVTYYMKIMNGEVETGTLDTINDSDSD